MKIIFSHSAFKQFSKLEKAIQRRIIDKFDFYLSQKDILRFAEKLTDCQFGDWRFRIGEYRIFFDIYNDKINILKIGHRKDVYK